MKRHLKPSDLHLLTPEVRARLRALRRNQARRWYVPRNVFEMAIESAAYYRANGNKRTCRVMLELARQIRTSERYAILFGRLPSWPTSA